MPNRLDAIDIARIEDALRDELPQPSPQVFRSLAVTYRCHKSSIYRQWNRIRRDLPVQRRSGGPRAVISFEVEVAIRHLLELRPWYYQDEIRDFLAESFGITTTQSSISRALKRIKYTRKRLKVVAAQRRGVTFCG